MTARRSRWPSGARLERWPRFALKDVHRFAGLLTGTFLVVHIVTIAIDSYLPFSLTSLVVPFTSIYRPVFVGLGIIGAELLLALAVTNRLRDRLPYAVRGGGLPTTSNFVVWARRRSMAWSGTDRGTPWLVAIEATAIGAVLTATGWPAPRARAAVTPGRLAAVAGGGAVVAAAAVALVLGPLAFKPRPWNPARFTDALDGRILQAEWCDPRHRVDGRRGARAPSTYSCAPTC